MPNTMPGYVMKGPILEAIESWLEVGTQRQKDLQDALLASPLTHLCQILTNLGISLSPQDLQHLQDDWFGPVAGGPGGSGAWWPSRQPIEDEVRGGFWYALEMCRQARFQLNTLWVCTGYHFAPCVYVGKREVDLLLLTPPEPYSLMHTSFVPPRRLPQFGAHSNAYMIIPHSQRPEAMGLVNVTPAELEAALPSVGVYRFREILGEYE
jgi:hypothetical protein